jgi:hypothetical protein
MDHGLLLVLIQHVHQSVLQVYKLVIVRVLMKHLVDSYVLVMDFNLLIVQDIMIHFNAMVCILKKSILIKIKIYFE